MGQGQRRKPCLTGGSGLGILKNRKNRYFNGLVRGLDCKKVHSRRGSGRLSGPRNHQSIHQRLEGLRDGDVFGDSGQRYTEVM